MYPNRFKTIFEMKDLYSIIVTNKEIKENREIEEYIKVTEGK